MLILYLREELKDMSQDFYDHLARTAGADLDQASSAQPVSFLAPKTGPTQYDQEHSATRRLETSRHNLRGEG